MQWCFLPESGVVFADARLATPDGSECGKESDVHSLSLPALSRPEVGEDSGSTQ